MSMSARSVSKAAGEDTDEDGLEMFQHPAQPLSMFLDGDAVAADVDSNSEGSSDSSGDGDGAGLSGGGAAGDCAQWRTA